MDRTKALARAMRTVFAALVLTVLPLVARAEVTRFEIVSVQRPALEGRAFGRVGQYEKLTARVTVAVDPADRRNAGIADIALAHRNSDGRVEAVADVVILRPLDQLLGLLLGEAMLGGGRLHLGQDDAVAVDGRDVVD